MRRKRNARIDIRVQALSVPDTMLRDDYFRALLRGMATGTYPRGLEVELHWRNPETKHGRSREWQSGEFSEVVADSSEGFSTVLRSMLRRRLYGGVQRIPKPILGRKRKGKAKRGQAKQKPLRDSKGRFRKRVPPRRRH